MPKVQPLSITPFTLAQRYIGIKEVPGSKNSETVMAMLTLDNAFPANDEVPWCSAFVNWIMWNLRLPRSKSLSARSWLSIGTTVELQDAEPGFDIVILKRGDGTQPGPEVTDAPGHVGFFAGLETSGLSGGGRIRVLGGNQGNQVSSISFPSSLVLGIRRVS